MMERKQKPGELLRGNERFEGYCKDLADAITDLTGIKFLIKPVKDGKYGSPDSGYVGGWNGKKKLNPNDVGGVIVPVLFLNSDSV